MGDHPTCPICQKGRLILLGPLLICAFCRKAWEEWEFLADVRQAGLNYYFTPDIHGTIVIYDPRIKTHAHIEP